MSEKEVGVTDSTQKAIWLGKWLLQIPAYLVTNYAVRWLISLCYRTFGHGASSFTNSFFVKHPLDLSLIAGFLGGLLAVVALHLVLLLPKLPAPAVMPSWKKAQAWTWVVAVAWFLYGVMEWWASQSTHSVLATGGTGAKLSDLFTIFFGSACNLAQGPLTAASLRGCMPQFGYTSPLLGCLAYSAAAFVPMQWLSKRNSSRSEGHVSASDKASDEA